MSSIIYTPPKALIRLFQHFKSPTNSMIWACNDIALRLNDEWSPKHIYDIFRGRSPSTPKFKARISQLDYKIRHPQRFWLGIHALTKEQKDKWKMIPMEVRRTFLDLGYNRWARDNLKCDNACSWQQPYGWVPEDGCPVHDFYPKDVDTPE